MTLTIVSAPGPLLKQLFRRVKAGFRSRSSKSPVAAVSAGRQEGSGVGTAGLGGGPESLVQISVGTQHFGDGLVTLTIRGDGRVTVVRLQASRESRHESMLDDEKLRCLAAELDAVGLAGLRPSGGMRQPGDVPVGVSLAKDGRSVHEQQLWYGDRYTDAGLARLIRAFDELVDEVESAV